MQNRLLVSDYIVILDAGHGSLDASGRYTTLPDKGKFFDHKDKSLNFHGIAGNSVFYEGVFNRILANKLRAELAKLGIMSIICYDERIDTELERRVQFANNIYQVNKRKAIFVSLHADAGGGEGWTIFTTQGKSQSDILAEFIGAAVKGNTPLSKQLRIRADASDGDIDKEKDFYVIKNTACPAVLIEHGFFDNLKEATALNTEERQDQLAASEAKGIRDYLVFIKSPSV